jgi:hypothetical protein
MSYVPDYINLKREDKKLYVSTQVLSSLVANREVTNKYTREELVDIAVAYAELLLKKLEK